jgi:hypothetical protein
VSPLGQILVVWQARTGTDPISGFHLALSILGELPDRPASVRLPVGHIDPAVDYYIYAGGEGAKAKGKESGGEYQSKRHSTTTYSTTGPVSFVYYLFVRRTAACLHNRTYTHVMIRKRRCGPRPPHTGAALHVHMYTTAAVLIQFNLP